MSLTKEKVIDQITVTENGSVYYREATRILEDGAQISCTYHRSVVAPGDDYSAQDARVQAICATVHTDEVIAAYKASQTKITGDTLND